MGMCRIFCGYGAEVFWDHAAPMLDFPIAIEQGEDRSSIQYRKTKFSLRLHASILFPSLFEL